MLTRRFIEREHAVAGSRNFNVNYFRAMFDGEKRGEPSQIHDVLMKIVAKPHAERTIPCGDDQLLLHEYRQVKLDDATRVLYFGQLTRMRGDLAFQADADGNVEELHLDAGEYLSEFSQFLFDPKFKVILYHGAPTNIAWTQFKSYIQRWKADTPIRMEPSFDPSIIEQLENMSIRKKIVIKVANPDKWPDDRALTGAISGANDLGVDHMEITYYGPRTAGGTIAEKGKQLIKWLIKNEPKEGDLEKVIIEGYENEDATERTVFDLVKKKIVDRRRYDAGEIATFVDHSRTAEFLLVESYAEHVKQLNRLYRTN